MKWKPPVDTCGAPVTDYIVEVDEGCTDDWLPHLCIIDNCSTVVKGLREGKRYKFRVKAVNVYGNSEPLEADAITAKNPFGELENWDKI